MSLRRRCLSARCSARRDPLVSRSSALARKYARRRLSLGLVVLALFIVGAVEWNHHRDGKPPANSLPTTSRIARESYTNPVMDRDFPDPDVLSLADGYVAFATGSNGLHVQRARSTTLTDWSNPDEALPVLPPWVNP